MKKMGFDYAKHMYDENFPDLLWDHVLRQGSNTDQWGFVTHSSDPVSLAYYQYMSSSGESEGRSLSSASDFDIKINDSHRRMDNNAQSQWWTEINSSMEYIKKKHRNVDTFVIDSEGHCSFGLFYPLLEESFETWAAPIVKERMVIGNRRPSVAAFFASLVIGGILVIAALRSRQKRIQTESFEMKYNLDSSPIDATHPAAAKGIRLGLFMESFDRAVHPLATKCQSLPWTSGYLLASTIYFISMLISQGFAHPLDNLALGPSAVGLSTFGINNPALIIYRLEHFRLVTSSFLCSGIIPYLLMAHTLYRTDLEAAMLTNNHPAWHFLVVVGMISFVCNLGYACTGYGSSCSSLALALGLSAFSTTMHRRSTIFNSQMRSVFIAFILGCTPLLPFESWISLTTAVLVGVLSGLALFVSEYRGVSDVETKPSQNVRWKFVQATGIIQLLMYILLLLRVPSPDTRYLYPYQTGCGLVYSDEVGGIVEAYASSDRRVLEGDFICAQTCIPHLVCRLSLWGANQFSPFSVKKGTCDEHGYDAHIADKTFRKYSVIFEVQLFSTSANGAGRLL